jgi:hypothetical protein
MPAPRKPRPRPAGSALRIPESVEQRHIVVLLRTVRGEVWELGTKRSRKDDHMGTRQTPGVPDVLAFLPPAPGSGSTRWVFLFIEAKGQGGRLRPEQKRFRELALLAELAHIVGGQNEVIAWLLERGYLRREQVPHYRLPVDPTAPTSAGATS